LRDAVWVTAAPEESTRRRLKASSSLGVGEPEEEDMDVRGLVGGVWS
jgi:hypothetical protein